MPHGNSIPHAEATEWAQFATLFYTTWKRNLKVTSSCKEICQPSFRKSDFTSPEHMLSGGGQRTKANVPHLPFSSVMSILGRRIENIRMLFPSAGLKP